MPSRKKRDDAVPIEDIEVVLSPVLGIEPRVYVSVAWATIAVLAVFFLLVLPGLRRNGTVLTVHCLPADASVIVDGVRLGVDGGPVFAPKGERKLTVSRPGFVPYDEVIAVKGRVFASRLFPRKMTMQVVLEPRSGERPFVRGYREFALWAATGGERDRYAVPPMLTQAARDALASGDGGEGVVEAALPLATDDRYLADLLRADFLIAGGGAPLGVSTIVSYVESIADASAAGGVSAVSGVVRTLGEDGAEALGWSELLTNAVSRTNGASKAAVDFYRENPLPSLSVRRVVGGAEFVLVPGGKRFIGDFEAVTEGYNPRSGAFPTSVAIASFLIGATEVSNREFADFVEENPEWAPANRDNLIEEGKADGGYLAGWTVSSPPVETASEPVTGVSWHAASAYAAWFTERFLSGTGSAAVLPREDQWETAARLNGIAEDTSALPGGQKNVGDADTGKMGLIGMAGNVREWCSNPYRRNEYLYGTEDGPVFQTEGDQLAAPERAVRGGAYIDGKLPYPAAVRGGLRPETTSPVIGFRIAIVE